MVVKSSETRDWLGCIEPKSVRAVMKRIVEDLITIDWTVGQFFEEGKRVDKSSESSRRTSGLQSFGQSSTLKPLSKFSTSQIAGSPREFADTTLSSTLGKLWTEKVEYFSSVQFNRLSVTSGVVKICLKTLLESVRLKTFGKFGLQQMQVDCRYLQTLLWRFVQDEKLVDTLLDEILSSTLNRCIEVQLMEPSVIELICEVT
uniref:Vacuolar protein sorting-associated protein 51 homolog n=1 Tax=Romanomermis culicivorax TaxID=13658 RepID=A0A915JVH3_ROMCU